MALTPPRLLDSVPYDNYSGLWDDLPGPVGSLAAGAATPDPIAFGPSGNIRVFGMDGGATSEMFDGVGQVLHVWEEGTELRPHIHYCSSTTGTGSVKFYLDYYALSFGQIATGAPTTTTATGTADGTPWKHQIASFPPIPMTGKTVSSLIIYRLYRDPGTDTYGSDICPLSFDFHFLKDSDGSGEEYVK